MILRLEALSRRTLVHALACHFSNPLPHSPTTSSSPSVPQEQQQLETQMQSGLSVQVCALKNYTQKPLGAR